MTNNEAPATPEVLRDNEGAVFGRVDGMHGTRYIEMFLAPTVVPHPAHVPARPHGPRRYLAMPGDHPGGRERPVLLRESMHRPARPVRKPGGHWNGADDG